jgi:anti-sigma regulatory factor (Ser/Thr protein kinase)
MRRQRTVTRLAALEVRILPACPPELVTQLAREAGCTEAELLAEAEALAIRFARAAATTWEAQLRIVAADHGIPIEDLRAELEQLEIDTR